MSWLRPWRDWSIRSRMVLSVAAIAIVALVVTDTSGVFLLHKNLIARIDSQLRSQADSIYRQSAEAVRRNANKGSNSGNTSGNNSGNSNGSNGQVPAPAGPQPEDPGAPKAATSGASAAASASHSAKASAGVSPSTSAKPSTAPQASATASRPAASSSSAAAAPSTTQTNTPHIGLYQALFAPPSWQYQFDVNGKLTGVDRNNEPSGPDLAKLGDIRNYVGRTVTAQTYEGYQCRLRVTALASNQGYWMIAVSLKPTLETEQNFLKLVLGVSGLVLMMICLAAALVVRMGLKPLTKMQATAGTIAQGDLSCRVPDVNPHTESGKLGDALNVMLGRIETAVAEQAASEQRLRQVLADAAHELRTPLTSIQGFAELYRRGGAPPGPALDEAMGRIESEVGRMRLLVNDMLLLARLDEERPLNCQPVDLLSVAADTVRDAHVRVPNRFVGLAGIDDRRGTFEPVTAIADEARIRQVVTNLVANALQHTTEDSKVTVRIGRPAAVPGEPPPTVAIGSDLAPGRRVAAIEVVDTGPGMTPHDAAHVFERLYRADPSRSRRHGGAGLGLAIVASIVKAHGGRVELWTAPGAGARFRVLLPARPPMAEGFEDDDDFEPEFEPDFEFEFEDDLGDKFPANHTSDFRPLS